MSKHCPVCNAEYPDAATFCSTDGSPLDLASETGDRFIGKVLDRKVNHVDQRFR